MRRNAHCSVLALPILPLWAALVVAGPQTEGSPSATDQPEPLEEGFPFQPVPYEPPPVLKSADLLPAEVLSGPHHRVVEAVPSDGFLTRFTIESDFGAFEAASPALALTRIQEIGALAELEKLETEDLARDGFEHSAERLKASFRHLAKDPEGTLKGVPTGVGRFFNRLERAAKTGYQTIQDRRA